MKTIAASLSYKYNHATVLYNINKFNDLYETQQLHHVHIYESVSQVLQETKTKKNKEETAKKLHKYAAFLDWFRTEVNETTMIDSIYFVNKYFSIEENE